MSTQELETIKKTLADLTKEVKQTDAAAEDVRRAFENAQVRVKELKQRSDRVQRRLADATS